MPTTTKKPATKKAAPVKHEPMKRADAVAALRAEGYAGPVSYSVPALNDMLLWLRAGAPEGDGSVPIGAMHAMHPHLKPQPKAKQKPAAYLRALSDLRAMLDDGADLDAVAAWAKQEGAA